MEDSALNGGNVLGIWQDTLQKKGFTGLYDGWLADVTGASMRNALKFFFKDSFYLLITRLRLRLRLNAQTPR
jgi:hypothetical protein